MRIAHNDQQQYISVDFEPPYQFGYILPLLVSLSFESAELELEEI